MTYGVIITLRGALRAAVSVEWTEAAAPIDSGTGWEPCVRLSDGRWRLARHDSAGILAGHWRPEGRFGNIGLRYRLVAGGAWSPVSADRKEIEIVALSSEDAPHPVKAGDWSVPAALTLAAGQGTPARAEALRTGAFVLGGPAAAAVAVQWTAVAAPAEADWRDCGALAGRRWHLGAGIAGNLAGVAIRYRLAPEGAWSAASEDRKPLGFPDLPVVPVLLLAPFLLGTGRIGEPVALEPGLWTGAPDLAFQWCRNGVAISGAVAASYRPGTADDGQGLTCRVTASTTAGRLEAVTASLSVTYVPPVAVGTLEEEVLDQGTGTWTVAAAPAFKGQGLRFSVTGAGASVDAASGVVSLTTDVARAATVAVTATNSGGTATVSFRVTVEAAEGPVAPLALGAAGWSIPATVEVGPSRYAGVIELAATGPAAAAVAVEWRDGSLPAGTTLAATALGGRRWRMDDPSGAGRNLVLPGGAKSGVAVRYRLAADGAQSGIQNGIWSDLSTDTKAVSVPAFWRPLERTPEMFAKAPATYGFGYQYMRSMMACEDEPQYVIGGGDMNGIRLSDTGGTSWFHPPSVGLRCPGFNSVAIDPRDHKVLLAAGNMVWWGTSAKYQGRCGLWRSTDFGDSWTQVLPLEVASTDEYNQSLFAYAPGSRASAPSARVWYFLQSVRTQGKAREGAQLWRSADGGASWAKVGAQIGADQFGEMYALLAHPVTANRFHVAAQTGLWSSTDGGITWTKVAGNLPAAQCRSLAISPDGATLYASIQSATATQAGVWRSANGGTGWTRIQDNVATKRLSVDWKTKPETIYVQLNQSTGADLLVAKGAAGPWTTPSVTPMLGYEDDSYHKRLSTKGSYDGVLAHPGAAGVCLINSVGRIFRSTDTGASFADASQGFSGINFAAQLTKLAVDPKNSDRFAIAVQDVNLYVTTDRGRSGRMQQISSAVFSELMAANPSLNAYPRSSYGIALLPSGRILLSVGNYGVQGLVSTDDNGETYKALASVPVGDFNFIGYHPTTPTAVVAGQRRSTDGGASFPVALEYVAQGLSAGGALYGRSGNNIIMRSANWTGGAPTWTEFYKSPVSLRKYGLNSHLMAVDPKDEFTVWTIDTGGDLIRVRNTGTTGAAASVTSFPLKGEAWGGTAAEFGLSDICCDPNEAGLVYVTLFVSGARSVWRGRVSGTTITWEDITLNAPKWQELSVSVLPGSGEVVIGGGVGGWLLSAPPAGDLAPRTVSSVWSSLPEPVRRF